MIALSESAAHAQVLELGSPQPPELDGDTAAKALADALELEIEQRQRLAGSGNDRYARVMHAQTAMRQVACTLLRAGDAAGREGSCAIVAAMTIAVVRYDIDAALNTLIELDERLARQRNNPEPTLEMQVKAADEALVIFAEALVMLQPQLDRIEPARLDATLPALFASLARAVAILAPGDVAGTHWPDGPDRHASADHTAPDTSDGLRAVLVDARVDAELIAALEPVIAGVDAAREFPEFRAQALADSRAITMAVEIERAVREASWLDPPDRLSLRLQIASALHQLAGRTEREAAGQHLEAMHTGIPALDAITRAINAGQPRINPEPLRERWFAALSFMDDPATRHQGRELFALLETIANDMRAYRLIGTARLAREWATAIQHLSRRYEESEKALLARLADFDGSPQTMQDPELLSLLASFRQPVIDIERLKSLPQWIDAVAGIDSASRAGVHARLQQWATHLLDPVRRPEAVMALEQVEQQIAMFLPMPFEDALRQGSEVAVAMTGGQQDVLLRAIQDQRLQWVKQLARGDIGSDAANQLLRVASLLQLMQDLTTLDAITTSRGINAWAAWELPDEAAAAARDATPNRIRLAIAELGRGNAENFGRQCIQLQRDAPLAQLLARFAALRGDAFAALTGGAVGGMAELTTVPTSNALLLDHRTALADICRYSAEATYAEKTGRTSLAEACRAAVNALANEMLEQSGASPAGFPRLIGFDSQQ